MYFMK